MTGSGCFLHQSSSSLSSQEQSSQVWNFPLQLRRDDLLFVLIPSGEKGPRTPGWNKVSNGMKWDDPRLVSHIQSGGNYGFYPAPGSNLLSIDVDDAEKFHQAGGKDLVDQTYCYSAWGNHERYRAVVDCPDIPQYFRGHKIPIQDSDRKVIFELFLPANAEKTGGVVVGPGSRHPNGNLYIPYDDQTIIRTVTWESIQRITSLYRDEELFPPVPELPVRQRNSESSSLIRDKYGISVMDHLPLNYYLSNQEIRGEHPIHGSTSKGGNVVLNPMKGVFYCFRCQRGGDATIWDAICRGIIRCDEEYDMDAIHRHLKILDFEKPEVKYQDQIAWKRNLLRRGNL